MNQNTTNWGFLDYRIKEKYSKGDIGGHSFRCSDRLWDDFKNACEYNDIKNSSQVLQVLMSYFIDKTNQEKESNPNAPKLRQMLKLPRTKRDKMFDSLSLEEKIQFLHLEEQYKRVQKYTIEDIQDDSFNKHLSLHENNTISKINKEKE